MLTGDSSGGMLRPRTKRAPDYHGKTVIQATVCVFSLYGTRLQTKVVPSSSTVVVVNAYE